MIRQKWLLIGHRGAGKTSFWKRYAQDFEYAFDLDAEVEARGKRKITEIFERYGENAFRELEETTLAKLLAETKDSDSVLLSLGAGYAAHLWPRDFKGLWIRRETDIWPRFYFDRPPTGTSDADNFLQNFIEREGRYQKWADCALTLEEGETLPEFAPSAEPAPPFALNYFPFGDTPLDFNGAYLTLHPHFHNDLQASVELRSRWGVAFELRTDLWKKNQIEKILRDWADLKFLVSLRDRQFAEGDLPAGENLEIDWDLSLGRPPRRISLTYVSRHDFSEGLLPGLKDLQKKGRQFGDVHLKAAPLIGSFAELEVLHRWWSEEPDARSILPRGNLTATLPQWQWFRLYMKGRQRLHFVREASEGLRDQPTLLPWLRTRGAGDFAAILGQPVLHSYSPIAHRNFFGAREMNFLAIPVDKENLQASVFSFLARLGARAFAVTSPLKESPSLAAVSRAAYPEAEAFFNTLVKKGDTWLRANTDRRAIEKIAAEKAHWKIWGAGAVARQFFECAQSAELYSASKGERLQSKGATCETAALLWAAGEEAPSPPAEWKFSKVVDLSYAERSSARLYASHKKIPYCDGRDFFVQQAEAQRAFWKEYGTEHGG